ncbi:MAG: adenylate/guanylate cyclase domain-containing protein [Phycisphaerales bacterium]
MSTERRQENKFIVYTDIVGHTKMLGRLGMAFRPMRERHDELFRLAVRQHADMSVVKGSGDGFYAAFEDVDDALEVALAFRRSLATEDWTKFLPEGKKTPDNFIRSRVGIHSGQVRVQYDDGVAVDFDGVPRNVCEKVMSKAQGNQVLVTRQVRDQGSLNFRRNSEVEWQKYGEFKLREVADTVEIWGLGEAELTAGSAPVQDPEHRVIIFAVVHDHSTVIEQAGPQFEGLKDKWDATFQKAIDAHSRDAFVKRLPEGSLAAFRTPIEAVRAARDFRRMWKAEMRTSIHRLEPKTALDSGLVTFSYENNRPSDVRDQPVNMAAKVAKTGLTAPWQLLLTRPVREDAFSNMPERDEFAWVCVGRKAVPGEPEPVELWDFQDVQVKKEDRAVLWVDLTHIRDDLKARRDVYIRFVSRLDAMLGEALARRAEQAWTLSPDAARIAAFRDPVEAVQAAIDLRDQALAEDWSQQFKNRSKGWHPLKLTLHLGAVRMTSEDGQRKEIKGAPIEGLKCLVAACEMSQMLVSREFKETVSRHLPETLATWSRVDVPARNDVAVEGFELGARRRTGRPLWQKAGAIGVAAAVVLGAGVVVGKMVLSRGGRADEGFTDAGVAPRAMTEVLGEFQSELNKITPPEGNAEFPKLTDEVFGVVTKVVIGESGSRGQMVSGGTQRAIEGVLTLLRGAAEKGTTRVFEPSAIMAFDKPALSSVKDGEQLGAWVRQVSSAARVPIEIDPRTQITRTYENLKEDLNRKSLGTSKEAQDLERSVRLPDGVRDLPWVEGNREEIVKAVRAASEYLSREKLDERIYKLTSGGGDDPTPAGARKLLDEARTLTRTTEMEAMVRAATSAARARAVELRAQNIGEDQIERELGELIKPIVDAARDLAPYDIEDLVIEHAPQPEQLSLQQISKLMREELPRYRYLDEKMLSVERDWRYRLDEELVPLRGQAPAADVQAALAAATKAIDEFPSFRKLPWIVKNREEIARERAKVDAAFNALASAVSKQAETIKASVTASKTPALGPIPDNVVKAVEAFAGDASKPSGTIGSVARDVINAAWEESRRRMRSPDDALRELQRVVTQLQALAPMQARLHGEAIAADREKYPEFRELPKTVGQLEGWLSRMAEYVRIEGEDPRPGIGARLDALEKTYVGTEVGKVTTPPREFLDARVDYQNIRVDSYPWIERNRGFVVGRAEALAKALEPGGPIEIALKRAAEARESVARVESLRSDLRAGLDRSPVDAAAEPAIFDEWRTIVSEERGKQASSDVDELTGAVQRVNGLFGFLAELGRSMPVPEFNEERPWVRSVEEALRAQRADAIRTAIRDRKAGAVDDAGAKRAYAEAAKAATEFARVWSAIEDAFRQGAQLGDALPALGGKTLKAAILEVRESPLVKTDRQETARVRAGLDRQIRKAEALLAVEGFKGSLAELMRYADDTDVGIETRIAVWNTMGAEAFLNESTWLRDHIRVFGRVEDGLSAMDAERAGAIRQALKREKPQRWFMFVDRATSFNAIDVAMRERATFEVTDQLMSQADPRVRWNLKVWEVESGFQVRDEERTRSAIAALLADAGAVAVGQGKAAGFLNDLRSAMSGAGGSDGGAGAAGADQVGPGTVGWKVVEGTLGGPRLTYRMEAPKSSEPSWVFEGEPPQLTFVKVPEGGVDAYICTTELSIHVAFESLRRNREEVSFTGLYLRGRDKISRTGPFSWDFDQAALSTGYLGGINKIDKGAWVCMGTANTANQVYGAAISTPDRDSPIQYVSLPGAVFLARLVGCRLPTPREWKAAADMPGSIAGTPNLRDLTYRPVYSSVMEARLRFGGSVTDLDSDTFLSKREERDRFDQANDGEVFFSSVSRGDGVFKHMIGNVAELLCDDRVAASEIGQGLNKAITFVEERKDVQSVFAVVGDSAIAPPQPDPKQPRFLTFSRSIENAMMKKGWSDVGMRLAFSGTPPRARVALGEQGLLVGVQKAFQNDVRYVASN